MRTFTAVGVHEQPAHDGPHVQGRGEDEEAVPRARHLREVGQGDVGGEEGEEDGRQSRPDVAHHVH